jgi:hypothetical protein
LVPAAKNRNICGSIATPGEELHRTAAILGMSAKNSASRSISASGVWGAEHAWWI